MGFQDRDRGKQLLDLGKGFPTDEDFKFGERNSDLWFVICVAEFGRLLLVQTGGEVFVRVDLEGKRFGD